MDGAAHESLPVELRAGTYRLAIGRKMNSIRAARVSNLGITVHRQTGSELAGNRQQLLRECDLIGPRQVLLAQANPAASTGERGGQDVGKRLLRLGPIGNEHQ
jgi:hypothetical protein